MKALQDRNDIVINGNQPSHLQRNKTERIRLQGLQRTTTNESLKAPVKTSALGWIDRWRLWMINEGGNRMFFFVFILLHLLVGVLGMLHYSLKDNLANNRRQLGAGFSTLLVLISVLKYPDFVCYSYRSCRGDVVPRRCHLHSPPRLPKLHLTPSQDSFEHSHSFRQEHYLPQSNCLVNCVLLPCPRRCPYGQLCQTRHG